MRPEEIGRCNNCLPSHPLSHPNGIPSAQIPISDREVADPELIVSMRRVLGASQVVPIRSRWAQAPQETPARMPVRAFECTRSVLRLAHAELLSRARSSGGDTCPSPALTECQCAGGCRVSVKR
jgi:hypothetical protein